MSHYEIFSSDPALLTYFAKHLQEPSCTIIKEEDRYELCSSDIDALESSVSLGQGTNGLLSVFHLLSPNFKTLRTDEKVRVGVNGLLFMLNGVIKLKYKMPGLTRELTISPSQVRIGIVSMRDDQGRKLKTTARDLTMRANITVGEDFLLAADTRSPTAVEIWRLARSSPPIARALYYYGKAQVDDTSNLRKVVEEIMVDTYTGSRNPNFKEWKEQWPKNVGGRSKIENLWEWLNNAYVTGDKAAHSPATSFQQSTNMFISTPEALDIIHTLLTIWLEEKLVKP